MAAAKRRLGEPEGLTRQLQQTVPRLERILMARTPAASRINKLELWQARWLLGMNGTMTIRHTAILAFFVGLQVGIPQVIVVLVGFSMVAGSVWTATPEPEKRVRAAIHIMLLYLIFLILVVDYSQRPARSLRWMIVPLTIAFVLRHLPRKKMASELTSTPI